MFQKTGNNDEQHRIYINREEHCHAGQLAGRYIKRAERYLHHLVNGMLLQSPVVWTRRAAENCEHASNFYIEVTHWDRQPARRTNLWQVICRSPMRAWGLQQERDFHGQEDWKPSYDFCVTNHMSKVGSDICLAGDARVSWLFKSRSLISQSRHGRFTLRALLDPVTRKAPRHGWIQ